MFYVRYFLRVGYPKLDIKSFPKPFNNLIIDLLLETMFSKSLHLLYYLTFLFTQLFLNTKKKLDLNS